MKGLLNKGRKFKLTIFSVIMASFVFVSINSISLSATKPSQTPKSSPTKDIISFDTTLKKVPTNYAGHDIVDLYNVLNKFPDVRNEFETQDQYQKRINSDIEKITKPLYAFKITPLNNRASYDIDKQELSIFVEGNFGYNNTSLGFYCHRDVELPSEILASFYRYNEEKYTAKNIYGLAVEGKTFKYEFYGIYLLNKNDKKLQFTLSLSPSEAKDLKENLGIILISKIKTNDDPPSFTFFKGFVSDLPTMDKPDFWQFAFNCIYAELQEIWIYNASTGTIYLKETY